MALWPIVTVAVSSLGASLGAQHGLHSQQSQAPHGPHGLGSTPSQVAQDARAKNSSDGSEGAPRAMASMTSMDQVEEASQDWFDCHGELAGAYQALGHTHDLALLEAHLLSRMPWLDPALASSLPDLTSGLEGAMSGALGGSGGYHMKDFESESSLGDHNDTDESFGTFSSSFGKVKLFHEKESVQGAHGGTMETGDDVADIAGIAGGRQGTAKRGSSSPHEAYEDDSSPLVRSLAAALIARWRHTLAIKGDPVKGDPVKGDPTKGDHASSSSSSDVNLAAAAAATALPPLSGTFGA